MSTKKIEKFTIVFRFKTRPFFVPVPMLSLVGCAVCGFSVGITQHGTVSFSKVQTFFHIHL